MIKIYKSLYNSAFFSSFPKGLMSISTLSVSFPRFQFYSPVSFVKVFQVLREIVRCSIANLFISMSFDLSSQLELLRRGELITEQNVRMLCLKAREILINEPNIQSINPPITVYVAC